MYMSIAKRASVKVNDVYPVIATGKPHYMTRRKQRIAWELGYIKGYEEARREKLHKHIGDKIDAENNHS
jgi:hypothetical protein